MSTVKAKSAVKPSDFEVVTGPLPASRKVHVAGLRHADLRVPLRELELSPSAGEPPLRVYDSSGP